MRNEHGSSPIDRFSWKHYSKLAFEIPIYRMTREKHTERLNKHLDKTMESVEHYFGEFEKIEKISMADKWSRSYWHEWEYNSIVGFLCIYTLGVYEKLYIGCELRLAKHRSNSKAFVEYDGAIFTIAFSRGMSKPEVWAALRSAVDHASEHERIRRFHVDTRAFDQVGPHIDWLAMMNCERYFIEIRLPQKEA